MLLAPVPAASCNWKYTAAAEWDGKECKLETTLFGTDGSATYGGTPILKEVKELVSNTVWCFYSIDLY